MRRCDDAEDDDRDLRAERELSEVERCLQRALPPYQTEGERPAAEPGGEQRTRAEQQQPDDGRDFGERERVGVPADVDVDDVRLGERERERDAEP